MKTFLLLVGITLAAITVAVTFMYYLVDIPTCARGFKSVIDCAPIQITHEGKTVEDLQCSDICVRVQ